MRRIALLAVLASVIVAAPAGAATLTVGNTNDEGPGSLGETILEAEFGDTIVLPPGEYLLVNGDVMVARKLTLEGAGDTATTVVPSGGGEALDRVPYSGITVASPRQSGGEEDGDGTGIETKAQIIALVATLAFFLLILELVRRRRLVERYALLWMGVAIVLLVLSVWTDGLGVLADVIGIEEPANAIFLLAFGAAFALLLNFSVATSRLSEETKILAQEAARLEQELRAARGEVQQANGDAPAELDPDESAAPPA